MKRKQIYRMSFVFRSGEGEREKGEENRGGKRLEGKRKGHVCETGAVWYFSCQPEK